MDRLSLSAYAVIFSIQISVHIITLFCDLSTVFSAKKVFFCQSFPAEKQWSAKKHFLLENRRE